MDVPEKLVLQKEKNFVYVYGNTEPYQDRFEAWNGTWVATREAWRFPQAKEKEIVVEISEQRKPTILRRLQEILRTGDPNVLTVHVLHEQIKREFGKRLIPPLEWFRDTILSLQGHIPEVPPVPTEIVELSAEEVKREEEEEVPEEEEVAEEIKREEEEEVPEEEEEAAEEIKREEEEVPEARTFEWWNRKTVAELKTWAKSAGIPGYYKMRKNNLIEALLGAPPSSFRESVRKAPREEVEVVPRPKLEEEDDDLESKTVVQLKALAKERGLKRYSALRKLALIQLLREKEEEAVVPLEREKGEEETPPLEVQIVEAEKEKPTEEVPEMPVLEALGEKKVPAKVVRAPPKLPPRKRRVARRKKKEAEEPEWMRAQTTLEGLEKGLLENIFSFSSAGVHLRVPEGPPVPASLEELLEKRSAEDPTMFQWRKQITEKIAQIPDFPLQPLAALLAGSLLTNKLRYGVRYDTPTERALEWLIDRISTEKI